MHHVTEFIPLCYELCFYLCENVEISLEASSITEAKLPTAHSTFKAVNYVPDHVKGNQSVTVTSLWFNVFLFLLQGLLFCTHFPRIN